MGAGSTPTGKKPVSLAELRGDKRKPCKSDCRWRTMRRDIGICRFANTGEKYYIDQCRDCKRDYLVLL